MTNWIICGVILSFVLKINALSTLTAKNGNKYYIELENVYNWYHAVHQCVLMNASLVAIESQDKQEEIFKLLKDHYSSEKLAKIRLWSAGHDNAVEGNHKWISNGRELTFTNWASNEPNNADDKEHCVELRPGDFKWNDAPCSLKLNYICEENRLVLDTNFKCNQQINDLKKSHDQAMTKTQQNLDDLKKSHEELTILVKSQKQQMEDRDKEFDQLRKSHQEELTSVLQKHNDEIETVRKSYIEIIEDYKLKLDDLQKAHQNATNLLLEEKNRELKELNESSVLQLALALESEQKLCANETSILLEKKTLEFMDQKNQELEDLKENHEKAKALELATMKKSHEYERNQLREEQEQQLETLLIDCEEKSKKIAEAKNLEYTTLQKVNELQMNPTYTYNLYNFVFHRNNNNKDNTN